MQNNVNNRGPESTRIRVLVDSVARRIAAGEVIDRPYSVIRELLDNAIDAGSKKIRLDIERGGIDSITCTDDGLGMLPEDLKLSILPHATSKIRDFDDLYRLSTLGFRGEALSSIAACSRLEIVSCTRGSGKAGRLFVHAGKIIEEGEGHGAPGTRVHVEDLFYSLPGRKKFLKTPGAEANLCTAAFLEKSLPFPDIEFRYFNNGALKTFLSAGDLKNRVCSSYPKILNPELINCWDFEQDQYHFSIAGASPSIYRKDRRYIQIYVNKRRINDFALTQAVEYGYSDYLPGGCYPMAFVFITIPPDKVDFNIHPSKKEVRFRDSHGLHRALVAAVKSGLSGYGQTRIHSETSGDRPFSFSEPSFSPRNITSFSVAIKKETYKPVNREIRVSPLDNQEDLVPKPQPETAESLPTTDIPIRYVGQVMNLFLAVERGDSFYLIDQHAAHERILYDQFLSNPGSSQGLLVPLLFDLDPERDRLFQENISHFNGVGFKFEKIEKGRWQMTGIPSRYNGMEDEIVNFFNNPRGDYSQLEKKLNDSAACRKAVKDGDVLDDLTAIHLAEETFRLPLPRCPHGRPVLFQLSREELFRLFGRII